MLGSKLFFRARLKSNSDEKGRYVRFDSYSEFTNVNCAGIKEYNRAECAHSNNQVKILNLCTQNVVGCDAAKLIDQMYDERMQAETNNVQRNYPLSILDHLWMSFGETIFGRWLIGDTPVFVYYCQNRDGEEIFEEYDKMFKSNKYQTRKYKNIKKLSRDMVLSNSSIVHIQSPISSNPVSSSMVKLASFAFDESKEIAEHASRVVACAYGYDVGQYSKNGSRKFFKCLYFNLLIGSTMIDAYEKALSSCNFSPKKFIKDARIREWKLPAAGKNRL